ncbi:hypothetical protein FF38_03733 [Lucilia cuprina]|uniref:Uncharacterized protein n=1 Tax=Lucilia cuprina TaxID=7375 RepID=A0A0L0BTZ1_LUCCU|nr:hypothetical protein FF38_03733 [Lucilia cuprina]
MRIVKIWKGLYCRWNPSMRPQNKIYNRTRELLAVQEQLVKQVSEKRMKANMRQTIQASTRIDDSSERLNYMLTFVRRK